jgi:heptosyltransferase-2
LSIRTFAVALGFLMPKILIIAPSWVGDAVMAQPLLRRLRERYPSAVIDAFAPAWVAPVLELMPEIRRVVINPLAHGELSLKLRWKLGRALQQDRYDHAIILPNSLKSALIPFFADIPLRTGFKGEMRFGLINDMRRLDKRSLPMMVERFAALAEYPGTPLHRPLENPRLTADKDRIQVTLNKLGLAPKKPVVAFCVGAEYGPAKRWPAPHFAELARMLADAGHEIWLLGSHKDAEIGAEIEKSSHGAARNLCGQTDLAQAIDLLATANLAVVNDSGLMHIAAALDKPMIALFGSSSPGFTPPLSDQARVVSLSLPCAPCFKRVCPLGHFDCMVKLTPQRVFEEAAAILQHASPQDETGQMQIDKGINFHHDIHLNNLEQR